MRRDGTCRAGRVEINFDNTIPNELEICDMTICGFDTFHIHVPLQWKDTAETGAAIYSTP